MNFEVPTSMKQRITVSDQLPEHYSKYRIPGTVVHITEGPFGAFFKQELHSSDWIVGWLNFDIKEHIYLYPVTKDPLLGVVCRAERRYSLRAAGLRRKADAAGEKIRFLLRAASMAFNRAEFAPAHYTAVYISFFAFVHAIFREQIRGI